jgi:hypothetical protein
MDFLATAVTHCFLQCFLIKTALSGGCQYCVIVILISASLIVIPWFSLVESMICQYINGCQDLFWLLVLVPIEN